MKFMGFAPLGIMDYWNNGLIGIFDTENAFNFLITNIPPLHYSGWLT
jgi:hypothetical protein